MSETDPGPLPTSKIVLAVAIINGSPYICQVSRIGQETPVFIIYIHLSSILLTLLLSCKLSSISYNSPKPLISLCF